MFNDLWAMPDTASAEAHLAAWTEEGQRAGQPFVQCAKTIEAHWIGIVRFIESRLTHGLLEGIDLQLAKRRARGYRTIRNFIDMACFLCGKPDFSFSPGIPV